MSSSTCSRAFVLSCILFSANSLGHDHLSDHSFQANLNAIVGYQDSGWSWLDGGLGRYGFGEDKHDKSLLGELDLGYNYQISDAWSLWTYAQAQASDSSSSARDIGLIEFDVSYKQDLDFNQQVRMKFGHFFLPTSMENIDHFWDSPYTITYSSLNSWIGEEFRPIGLDLGYRYHFDNGERLTVAGTVFGGNDSMGALLAFRGWSYGRLKTVYGDIVALPELDSLGDGNLFERQMDEGSKPFGRDLDGKPGYAIRMSYERERSMFNFAWIDNRGDTKLHHGEYAWLTQFAILGASWFATDNLELLAESSVGSTEMGPGPGVDVDFYSAYVMASYFTDQYRVSLRHDVFGSDDEDVMDEENHDLGRSQTLAIFWTPPQHHFKIGFEFLYLNSKRSRMLNSGAATKDEESVAISGLVQYRF